MKELSVLARSKPSASLSAFALATVLGLSIADRARAADDDATTAMARERFKEGVQFFDQKQYDRSRAAFLQAYALKRHPAVLLNLAQSELRSGHEADAAKHFAQFLREAKDATDADRQSADAGLSASKAVVAEVTVSVDEEGAVVSINGAAEGTTPLPGPIYLSPGTQTVSAKKEAREVSVQINAVAGQSSSTALRLKKSAPPARAEGEEAKSQPAEAESEAEATSSETAGAPSREAATRPREAGGKSFFAWAADSPIAWVGGGLTVAGLAGGIGFGLAAKQSYDSASSVAAQIRKAAEEDGVQPNGICVDPTVQKSRPPEQYQVACAKYADKRDVGDNFKLMSTVSWVVGGVAAVGTVVLYFTDGGSQEKSAKRAPSRAHANVTPWLSGDSGGLFVSGTF